MNKDLLRGVVFAEGDTLGDLAKLLGIAQCTLSCKVNEKNNQQFTQREMQAIKDKYKLDNDKFIEIFFDRKLS